VQERSRRSSSATTCCPNTLLVKGPLSKAHAPPGLDEVAYVFPASDELINASRYRLRWTDHRGVAHRQYVKIRGGLPRTAPPEPAGARLRFGALDHAVTRRHGEIGNRARLKRMMRVANVKFSLGQSPTPPEPSHFFGAVPMATRTPFDGPGGVLAIPSIRRPGIPSRSPAICHLDADEIWRVARRSTCTASPCTSWDMPLAWSFGTCLPR